MPRASPERRRPRVGLTLTLDPAYRRLAGKGGGLAAKVTVTFTAPGHPSLRASLRVTFVHTPPKKEAKKASKRRKKAPAPPVAVQAGEQRRHASQARALVATALALGAGVSATTAAAQALEDDGGAAWHLEQPAPPPPPPGVPEAPAPIGLGRIGDIAFAPGMTQSRRADHSRQPSDDRTPACGSSTASPGTSSRPCAAPGDGRIVWAGPEEFWTISDGRPGQQQRPR